MKLLVDCHVFDGKFQGTRTYIQGIYQQMVSYKDIEFYFAAHDIEKLRETFGTGCNVHYIRLHSINSFKRLAQEFPKIIKDNHIDYAHFQYVSPLKKCCKEIITIHDLLFLDYPQFFSFGYRLKNNYFFKRSSRRADILLTVSKYSRHEISRLFGISEGDIHITPNAVLPIEKSLSIPDVKSKFGLDKFILSVSRIEPRKNHLALLKAFVDLKLANEGYKLMMVGVQDLAYKEFSDYYNNLDSSIKDAVVMMPVSFPELVGLYQQASLFVFPSFAEGFGIPPLEAIEYGCPVLCSNATAMAEFNFPQEFTFNPYDEMELKRKIKALLEMCPDLNDIRKSLKEKYNWKKISDDLYQVITNHYKNL